MKRKVRAIIIIAVLMLAGCNDVVTNRQTDTSTEVVEKKENSETGTIKQPDPIISSTISQAHSPSSSSTNSTSNYIKTYEDETHKEIKYGKLSFNIGSYHIASNTSSYNIETFKCEIDKGKGYSWTKTHMTITVRAIEKQNFPDTKSIVSYLNNMYPSYEKIKIYNNVTDNSGIIGLYIVTEGGLTKYIVCYQDVCYLIESDVSEVYLFKNNPSEYYEVHNQKIKCANSFTAYINNTISFNDNKFKKVNYNIVQGKDEKKYSAELSLHNGFQYHFTLKNENGENLLTLSIDAPSFNDVIKFIDVNMDGYADIQFLKQAGAMNNSYDLYVWDDVANNFVKVKCDEMLSYFEVHDGYLLNWQRGSAQSGIKQKLAWNKNTLIKESEEQYQAN